MALGDLMASRISQSSLAVVSNHLDDCASNHDDDVDLISLRRDSEVASSSYGNAAVTTATTMVYLPQTIVLCELRHDAFEACLPAGPSDSGLVSKWRPKDRAGSFNLGWADSTMKYKRKGDGYSVLLFWDNLSKKRNVDVLEYVLSVYLYGMEYGWIFLDVMRKKYGFDLDL